MTDIARRLEIDTEVARVLLDQYRSILGNDEDAIHDAIEGQTNLIETIAEGVNRIAVLGANIDAIAELIKRHQDRAARFERQRELLRTAVLTAMQQTGQLKLELPQATVTAVTVAPKCDIVSEADVPASYWKAADPKLDKKAVLAALKAGEKVPGAQLSPATTTLQIRLG